ncbi:MULTISPECIES: insecticidal delta-endotoxin Cry8Ea1 family protein [Bacillus]|uniref:insecticidal delta-endotoxin Cry8Ea1 family protein n=1 Tax=Bacillus TaxID=1386 RepID=UPI000772639D|nr:MULTISPECIES: insecticidal delta-endotoxin Cry8Ea1 family protein [Bacillus]KXH80343.1 hypothetical protein AU379_23955 [Bacillus sp. JH7]
MNNLKNGPQQLTTEITQNNIIVLTKNVGYEFYRDANKNEFDFNNTFRTMTMGVASLIPYGGMIISPVIDLIWPKDPTSNEKEINALLVRVGAELDQSIINYNKEKLLPELKVLKKELVEFEKLIHPTEFKGYSSLEDETFARCVYAMNVHQAFKNLINDCSKSDDFKTARLPMYTAIAILHLLFVKFMSLFGTTTEIGFSAKTFQTEFGNIDALNNKYLDYIQKTFQNGYQKLYSPKNRLTYMKIERLYNTTWNSSALRVVADIAAWKRDNKLNKEYTGWVSIGAKHYYLEYGKKKTGWFRYLDKWYYLSQEDKDKFLKGEMRTGWFRYLDKWYYLQPRFIQECFGLISLSEPLINEGEKRTGWVEVKKNCIDISHVWYYFNLGGDMRTGWLKDEQERIFFFSLQKTNEYEEGQMITGWFETEDSSYYFNPIPTKDNPKDYNGHPLVLGQMVTGWFEENNQWYYFAPKTLVTIDDKIYKKGQMITGTLTIKGITRHFGDDGICTNLE